MCDTKLKTAMHVAWLAELVFSLVNFTSTAELMTCWNHPIIGMALLYVPRLSPLRRAEPGNKLFLYPRLFRE